MQETNDPRGELIVSEADAQRLARELGITVAHTPGSGATYRYVVGSE